MVKNILVFIIILIIAASIHLYIKDKPKSIFLSKFDVDNNIELVLNELNIL
jgi:hypothetical protein